LDLYGEIVEYAAGPQPSSPLCDAEDEDVQMDGADLAYLAELEAIAREVLDEGAAPGEHIEVDTGDGSLERVSAPPPSAAGLESENLERGLEHENLERGLESENLERGLEHENLERDHESENLERGLEGENLERDHESENLERGLEGENLEHARDGANLEHDRESENLEHAPDGENLERDLASENSESDPEGENSESDPEGENLESDSESESSEVESVELGIVDGAAPLDEVAAGAARSETSGLELAVVGAPSLSDLACLPGAPPPTAAAASASSGGDLPRQTAREEARCAGGRPPARAIPRLPTLPKTPKSPKTSGRF
jgi:hypothetical protein